MTAFWLVMWVEMRGRWRALASLALLLGLVGGVVLGAAAGARRTDTAYPRLRAWADASQLSVVPEGTGPSGYYAALARLPQAAAVAPEVLYNAALPPGVRAASPVVQAVASPDGSYGTTVDRVKLLAGQMFGPREPGAAVINQQLADLEHLTPGGTLRLGFIPLDPVTTNEEFSKEFILSFKVTGIAVFDSQVVSSVALASAPTALLSPPFAATAAARSAPCCAEAAVRLRPGAVEAQFIAAAERLAKRYAGTRQQQGTGGAVDILNAADQVSATQRAIQPQAVALALFATLAALIALVVLSQLLSRQLTLDAAQYPALRALGVTRPVLVAVSLARLALVTGAGATLAVAIAIAGSPLMPIGPARMADPSPGISVDPLVLGAGFAAIVLLPLAILAPAAWRAATRAAGPAGSSAISGRPSALGAALSRWGSVSGGLGVRMAFEPGRGSTAVPVRSALAATMVTVGAVAGALVFGASLVTLVGTPHEYGQNWDAELDLGFGAAPANLAGQLLRPDPAVTGFASGDYGLVKVNGTLVGAIGLDPAAASPGDGYVTILAGRAPAGPGEIALGAKTMAAAHVRIGQDIAVVINHASVTGPPVKRNMRVVGEVILPAFSRGSFSPTDLGTGALLTASVLSEPAPNSPCPSGTCYNFFLIRYRPGTDEASAAATLTALATRAGCPPGACVVTSDQRPGDIRDYASVRDTPLVLGALLVVLAVGTLAHVLLTGVRRRRRDLAVLKTLGLGRGQVLRLVAWQAGAFGCVALLAGLPLGVLAGRQAWAAFADAAGIAPAPDIPMALILLTIPVTLLIAVLIALWPGWRAARLRPAAVLWTE
ncbi:ABC transporter permease [Trebonia kvetii]|uniref:ABC transporter permease n=1 Tax=Trebonia kvetii TaxID=2480626 RepID=A0A6P2BWE6_9ACTN|nr:ABC transporter permease [Trebonia kvetii]